MNLLTDHKNNVIRVVDKQPGTICVTFRRLRRRCQRPAEAFYDVLNGVVDHYCLNCFREFSRNTFVIPRTEATLNGSVGEWIRDRCILSRDLTSGGGLLYNNYLEWFSETPRSEYRPVASNVFAEKLRELSNLRRGTGRLRHAWHGIALKGTLS